MVTFSDIPYADAWRLGQKQEAMMEEIISMPDIKSKWDSLEVEEWMLEMIG